MAASSSAEKVTESADNADSGNSKDVASNSAKDDLQEKVGETTPPSWIARLADKFTPADKMGPPISAGLADLLKTVIRDRGSKKDEDKKRYEVLEKNLRPENCDVLAPPKVNKEIWSNIPTTSRSSDLEFQKTQNVVLRAMGPIVGVVDLLLKKDPEGKDEMSTQIVDKLMESVSLLAFANDDLNIMRKNNIKTELNFDFEVCVQVRLP